MSNNIFNISFSQIILLSLLLFTLAPSFAHESDYEFETEKLSNQQQWFKGFYLGQLEPQDSILQTYAIHYLTDEGMDSDENIKVKIQNSLEDLLNKTIQKEIYFLLTDICESDNYTEICIESNFHQKLIKHNPQNLMVYLLKINGEAISRELNKNILQSTYADISYGFGSSDIKQALMVYHSDKPIPIMNMEERMILLQQIDSGDDNRFLGVLKTNDFLSKNESEMSINFNIYIQTILAIPPFNKLIAYCKNYKNSKTCQHIGNLLIQSKTLISNHIGYEIKKSLYKNSKDYKRYLQVSVKRMQISDSMECYLLNNSGNFYEYSMLHPLHMNTFFENIEDKGEFEARKIASHTLKAYLNSKGIETKDDIYACDDILNMDYEDYLQQHKSEKKIKDIIEDYSN